MYDRVLITTDGSEAAESAIEPAVALAERFDAELHVLFVVDADSVSQSFGADQIDWFDSSPLGEVDELRDAAAAAIDRVTTRAETDDVEVVRVVKTGVPHRAIVAYAEGNDVDVIVMGSHGRGGISRLVLGSVTERVIRTTPISVLVTDPNTRA